jgi:hypothetical protein
LEKELEDLDDGNGIIKMTEKEKRRRKEEAKNNEEENAKAQSRK